MPNDVKKTLVCLCTNDVFPENCNYQIIFFCKITSYLDESLCNGFEKKLPSLKIHFFSFFVSHRVGGIDSEPFPLAKWLFPVEGMTPPLCILSYWGIV